MEQSAVTLSLHDQLQAWFEVNKKQVGYGLGIAAIIGLAAGLYVWRQNEKKVEAGEALTKAMINSAGNRAASVDTLLKVANDFPGSTAGGRALLQAAGLLFQDGKHAEGQSQFQRFLREYPDSAFAYEALFGIAVSLEAQGKADEAARAYGDLAARNPSAPVTPRAKFAQGRILESQGKLPEARDVFESLARGEPGSSMANEAAFRLEQIKAKLPAEAPKVSVVSTNALFK